jgi:hypothetical protein
VPGCPQRGGGRTTAAEDERRRRGCVVEPAKLRVVATGLRSPEGPVALADGAVLVVEIAGGVITRVDPDLSTVDATRGTDASALPELHR